MITMNKRMTLLLAATAWLLTATAEVYDAFKGIMPVTDKSVMKSLNPTLTPCVKVSENFGCF